MNLNNAKAGHLHSHRASRGLALIVAASIGFAATCPAQDKPASSSSAPPDNAAVKKVFAAWNTPVEPFRLIGNIHYVGPSGVSSFLITTPEGHILIDTGFEETVPLISNSVTRLGFRFPDIKVLLSSHAHVDHTGGHALAKQLTGARILMSEADAALLASAGKDDFLASSSVMEYKPAKADRLLRDGDTVELGGAKLTCHLTPGHTKGCTTWSMDVTHDGKVHHAVFFGSTSILDGVPLVGNAKYPRIAEDLAATYRKLKALPCDVFLAPHAGFFGLAEKAERLKKGATLNPFINPQDYRDFIEKAERAFLQRLEKERKDR